LPKSTYFERDGIKYNKDVYATLEANEMGEDWFLEI
jgi:hypothetical protein